MTDKSMKNQILLTIILTLAASFIYAISSGIRNNYCIMFNAIIENTGLSYSYISLVLAFGQLFYGMRVIIIILFLILPKTIFIIFGFAFLLGLMGMSTVPPVSGIINLKYRAKSIVTLYGIVFFIHQIGTFLGAYFGWRFIWKIFEL